MNISDEVAKLAAEIRHLKAALTSQGLAKADINRHEVVLAKVQALQTLKAGLAHDDPARDAAILARMQEERQGRQRQEKVEAAAQREELKVAETAAAKPLIQRKIFHFFCHTGNGDKFHYEPPPRLNGVQCGFGEGAEPHPAVYLTEKWDGTTMQATSSHIFKRIDSSKRKSADVSQRYDLKLVAWCGKDGCWNGLDFVDADARVLEALHPHLQSLQRLDDGLCVYFEVVHTNINTTFRHLPGFAEIRIFDFSRAAATGVCSAGCEAPAGSGRFLPFEETIRLAERFQLPLVGWERHDHLDAERIWEQLWTAADGRHYATAAAQLEGFVVREAGAGGRIAKARVEHITKQHNTTATGSALSCFEPQVLSLRHLKAIGLCV